MAAVLDYFSIGSTIWCRTCYDTELEGEVMAFDSHVKMLILKCPSTSRNAKLHDIHFVNLSLVSELQVKKEVSSVPDPPQSLNLSKLNSRVRNQVESKRLELQAISANVSEAGKSLFISIAKVMQGVKWIQSDICVMNNSVIITPPYRLENMRGDVKDKTYIFVKKLVEKHIYDLAMSSPTTTTAQVQNST